jgi:hypothetical protein
VSPRVFKSPLGGNPSEGSPSLSGAGFSFIGYPLLAEAVSKLQFLEQPQRYSTLFTKKGKRGRQSAILSLAGKMKRHHTNLSPDVLFSGDPGQTHKKRIKPPKICSYLLTDSKKQG